MSDLEQQGWIKLHRKFIDWEWFSDPKMVATFIHCLFEANWETKKWQGKTIERGSFITSYPHLSKKIGISVMQLRTCLNKLKSTGEITVKHSNKYSYISINNYNKYQQLPDKSTVNQQSNNSQVTTTKEYKEIKNIYSSLNCLTDDLCLEVANEYSVLHKSVKDLRDDLKGYCKSEGKRYKDYKATLQNWTRRAIKERKIFKQAQANQIPELPEISEEQLKLNRQKIQEIKANFRAGVI